jgi:hypothetical protein
MKAWPCLLALCGLLTACGAAGEQSGGGPASTSHVPETVPSVPADVAEMLKPPAIVLESAAGRQAAVGGGFCVSYMIEEQQGTGICTDMEQPSPDVLSTVRPGEQIAIVVEGSRVDGRAVVRHLGCDRPSLGRIPLGPGATSTWSVELPPGDYELELFLTFETTDGRSGDTSAALGLLVDAAAPLEIVPVPTGPVDCPAG